MNSRIKKLKEEQDALILAHFYTPGDVQDVADHVGDSFQLARLAQEAEQKTIIFCGVSFMGESAKILSPEKTVILPEPKAGCPLADMAMPEFVDRMKRRQEDLAVVCYINSGAEIKARADVCVTSSNAVKIVTSLSQKNILFIPDDNLGRYVAEQVPDKNFFFCGGYCHVHQNIQKDGVKKAKAAHPEALVLAHPECSREVLRRADHIGSTAEIIRFATQSEQREFIICTERGILHELKKRNPEKVFYLTEAPHVCPDMKTITLKKVKDALAGRVPEVIVSVEKQHGAAALFEMMKRG